MQSDDSSDLSWSPQLTHDNFERFYLVIKLITDFYKLK